MRSGYVDSGSQRRLVSAHGSGGAIALTLGILARRFVSFVFMALAEILEISQDNRDRIIRFGKRQASNLSKQ